MPLPDWFAQPRHRLPRTATPFNNETIDSYLARLARANHINIHDLRLHLSGTPKGRPRPEWVATASGWPMPVLTQRLRGLVTKIPRGTYTGVACRRCMASRGVFEPVFICRPRHVNLCYRHRLWFGDTYSLESQLDISALSEILGAQRKHYRLARRYGSKFVDDAYIDSLQIVRRWTERHDWAEHRNRRLEIGFGHHRYGPHLRNSVEIDVVNYPETVALASVLLSEHWRRNTPPHHDRPLISDPNATKQKLFAEVSRCLKIRYRPQSWDPLLAWLERVGHTNAYLAQVEWISPIFKQPNMSLRSTAPTYWHSSTNNLPKETA